MVGVSRVTSAATDSDAVSCAALAHAGLFRPHSVRTPVSHSPPPLTRARASISG